MSLFYQAKIQFYNIHSSTCNTVISEGVIGKKKKKMKERKRRKGKGKEKKIKVCFFSVYFFPFDCNLMSCFISLKVFLNLILIR